VFDIQEYNVTTFRNFIKDFYLTMGCGSQALEKVGVFSVPLHPMLILW